MFRPVWSPAISVPAYMCETLITAVAAEAFRSGSSLALVFNTLPLTTIAERCARSFSGYGVVSLGGVAQLNRPKHNNGTDNTLMLFGDGKKEIQELIAAVKES